MREIEASINPELVLDSIDEKEIVEYFGATSLIEYMPESDILSYVEFNIDADKVLATIEGDLSEESIEKLATDNGYIKEPRG